MQYYNTNGRTPAGKTPRRKEKAIPLINKAKDPVKVFCRIRPLKNETDETCIKLLTASSLSLIQPDTNRPDSKQIHYTFEHIFTSYSDQKEIFDYVALPILQGLLCGKNGLLFTYGVTGSGKTYTLNGEKNNPGILPRCISILFNTIENKQSAKFVIKSDKLNGFEVQSESEAIADRKMEKRFNIRTPKPTSKKTDSLKFHYVNDGTKIPGLNEDNIYAVFISYVEIYNNSVFDLLDESGGRVLQSKLIREDADRNMYVNGVTEIEVKSAEETFEQILIGQKRKRMAHTALNAESSRSHSIFNIRVVQLAAVARNSQGDVIIPERNLLTVGQLSLVDLAGSERCSRTQNTGMRLKEASSINNSLMNLRTCLEVLRENQLNGASRIVPYRDSRLTLLFKNYFEGDGAVKMIVCVNPSVLDYDENLQVMKFADMTQDVQVARPEVRHMPYRKTPKPPSRVLSAKSSTTTITNCERKSYSSYFGAPLPKISLSFDPFMMEANRNQMRNCIQSSQSRTGKYSEWYKDVLENSNSFRARLVDLSQSDVNHALELRNLQSLLSRQKSKSNTMAKNISDLETEKNCLIVQLDSKDRQIQELCENIRERDLKLTKSVFEKERIKQKFQAQSEKVTHELENKLRRQRNMIESAGKARATDKLKSVRQLIDNEIAQMGGVETENIAPAETLRTVASASNIGTATKDTPVVKRPVPVANRRHRRSKSVGEIWLEHTQVNPVPLGTLMQPTMKRRKSVTKLSKAEDITNPRQNKYCLLAQEADTDGELETKLYKGDIVPTCGGGAQVIFNDVECLTQRSPTSTPAKSTRKPYTDTSEQVVKKPRI